MRGPRKIIINLSKYELSGSEKRIVVKGFNFGLPPTYLDYTEYLVNFQLFYGNIPHLSIFSNDDLVF